MNLSWKTIIHVVNESWDNLKINSHTRIIYVNEENKVQEISGHRAIFSTCTLFVHSYMCLFNMHVVKQLRIFFLFKDAILHTWLVRVLFIALFCTKISIMNGAFYLELRRTLGKPLTACWKTRMLFGKCWSCSRKRLISADKTVYYKVTNIEYIFCLNDNEYGSKAILGA